MAAAEPDLRFPCTFGGCYLVFKNAKELRRHKITNNAHDYCEKIHMSCKWCGMDFGSLSGRDRHIRQNHPVDQDILCPGCSERFARAAGLAHHLETGCCSSVSRTTYLAHTLQKEATVKLLQNPQGIEHAKLAVSDGRARCIESTNRLVDADDWEISLKKVNLDDCGGSTAGPTPAEAAAGKSPPTPWTNGSSTSKQLFPAAAPTPTTLDWQKHAEELDKKQQAQVMWVPLGKFDPKHRKFNAEDFYDTLKQAYLCSYPGCVDENRERREFDDVIYLRQHLLDQHGADLHCPVCLRVFGTRHALLAHIEEPNNRRCRVARSKKPGEIVDRVSGGFLTAKTELRADVNFLVTKKCADGSEEMQMAKMPHLKWTSDAPAALERDLDRSRTKTVVVRSGLMARLW